MREALGVARLCLCPVRKQSLSRISLGSAHCAPGAELALWTQRPDLADTTQSQPIPSMERHIIPASKLGPKAVPNLLICGGNCQECCQLVFSSQFKYSLQTKYLRSQITSGKLFADLVFQKKGVTQLSPQSHI